MCIQLNMYRYVVTLCLLSRVTSSIPIRNKNPQNIVKRSASVPSENGYVFNQFGDNSGMYAMFASEDTRHDPYTGIDPFEMKSAHKLGVSVPSYPDLSSVSDTVVDRIPSHTISPIKYDSDYEISRAKSHAKYAPLTNKHTPSSIKSDIMIEKLKSMMHYAPPGHAMGDAFSSYETHSDYHNDDDDVRSSGRIMYDSYWPRIYHSPYEYEYKKGISELEKAKDKRYVGDSSLEVKPVHEHIENDVPHINTYNHDHNVESSTDNPIGGNGPFFSFVLNDYFDRNNEEDPLSFKGVDVDWGKEFDHENYRPSIDYSMISRRDRRLKDSYYTTPVSNYQWVTPDRSQTIRQESSSHNPYKDMYMPTGGHTNSYNMITPYATTPGYLPLHTYQPSYEAPTSKHYYSERNLETDEGFTKDHDTDKHELGGNKYSNHKKDYEADGHKFEGFRDFLDSFANKFGSEDHKRDFNYTNANNENKGAKKKGFHRVYHKDEFLEDKEFFDDSNNMSKAQENGSSKVHVGGSEALLRSQALASTGNTTNAAKTYGNIGDKTFENAHKTHDGYNTKGNKFVKLIDVAKQAARSNSADYLDTFKV